MALEGLHHITAITADAPGNVDFYARLLGSRLVKKTVNFDEPSVYHLYYGDETGTPGSIMTFFEFPHAARGTHGDGMVHRIDWRVADQAALDFWKDRLDHEGIASAEDNGALMFSDPEGLHHALVVSAAQDAPLRAQATDIPAEHAILGFDGVHAYASTPQHSEPLLTALGSVRNADGSWTAAGAERSGTIRYEAPPAQRGRQGAGSVHHIAWSAADDAELDQFRGIAATNRAHVTPIIDRQYFHSIYFREPSGVLFEVASRDVGFQVDEPIESLGYELRLPAQHEHLRDQLVHRLTPITNPRQVAA